jgi:hypothetical protein
MAQSTATEPQQERSVTTVEVYVVVWQHTASGRFDATVHYSEADAERYIQMFGERPEKWQPILQGWRCA